MKTNKRNIVIIEMKGDKVYMKYQSRNVGMTVDVTQIFNFGMFVQKVLEHPEDDYTSEFIDTIQANK